VGDALLLGFFSMQTITHWPAANGNECPRGVLQLGGVCVGGGGARGRVAAFVKE
jgi:hypothetical protein